MNKKEITTIKSRPVKGCYNTKREKLPPAWQKLLEFILTCAYFLSHYRNTSDLQVPWIFPVLQSVLHGAQKSLWTSIDILKPCPAHTEVLILCHYIFFHPCLNVYHEMLTEAIKKIIIKRKTGQSFRYGESILFSIYYDFINHNMIYKQSNHKLKPLQLKPTHLNPWNI